MENKIKRATTRLMRIRFGCACEMKTAYGMSIVKSIGSGCLVLSLLLTLTACGNNEQPKSDGKADFSTNTATLADAEAIDDKGTAEGTAQNRIKQEGTRMKIQIGNNTFTANLADNSSVDAFKELLKEGSLTLNMSDYGNMEKGADLGVTLPENNEAMDTQAGDIILYQGRTLVIYYAPNSWSLTPIGKIIDADGEALRAALGKGDVTVTMALE